MFKIKLNRLARLRVVKVYLILVQFYGNHATLLILFTAIINLWHHSLVIVRKLELRTIVNFRTATSTKHTPLTLDLGSETLCCLHSRIYTVHFGT